MKPETKVANAGSVGAAIGVLIVVFLPMFTTVTFTPEIAAVVSGAFAAIFNYLMSFAPKPSG